ncbi:TPA: hypothetical protein N0F65_003447 [Lagenidium giganteum]|uniref:Uncharacterized protein n=1 Tax=Lagenidium giganteum TaxID=4803 RepID=A0AAV2YH40_9STRA|nr:TPA: hypothetical protein N0F65_003447 [Lagenidium giganteum]
MAEAARTLGI